MPTQYDEVVREIGVQQGLFTREQAASAMAKLQELAARGQTFPLSVVLEKLTIITETDRLALENASRYRVHRDDDKEVARIIKESNYAPDHAVDLALSAQKDHYRQSGETIRLADFLVRQGAMSEVQKMAALKLFELQKRAGAGDGLSGF